MHKQVSCTLRHLSSSEAVVTFRVSGHLPGLHPNSYKPGWGCDTAATFVSEFQCPLLAQSGHRATEFQCRLLGVKRTSEESAAMSAFDPKRTSAASIPANNGSLNYEAFW